MTTDASHRSVWSRLPLLLVITAIFASGLFVGRYLLPATEPGITQPLQFISLKDGQRTLVLPTFWEAWDLLHEEYIGTLKEQDLLYGAVAGMVRAAGDPYTVFADPEATKQLEETLSGSFSGVGIEIGVRDGLIKVIAPLAGSPAATAGVRSGDVIVAIDQEHVTVDTSIDDVVKKIRGPKGSTVTLTLLHDSDRETKDIAIVRDNIEVESVKTEVADSEAHITITNFSSTTAADFSQAIRTALRQGAKGIIVDMRNNPGGFLQSAIEITGHFVPKGTVAVIEKGKNDATKEHRTTDRPTVENLPVVVLVNGGSASASEIVAGALQDLRQAPIIGEKTFGKGSVQDYSQLSDGSSLRVTIAKWFTPNGTSIQDQGITPAIEVKNDPDTDDDEPLIRARAELKQKIE